MTTILLLAGCLGAVEDNLDAAETTEPPAETFGETFVEYDGDTGLYACAGALIVAECPGVHYGENRWHEMRLPAGALTMEGDVEWDAWSSRTENLDVTIFRKVSDGWEVIGEPVSGESPLAFSWDVSDLAGHTIAIRVSSHEMLPLPSPAWGGVSLEQDFVLSATITSATSGG